MARAARWRTAPVLLAVALAVAGCTGPGLDPAPTAPMAGLRGTVSATGWDCPVGEGGQEPGVESASSTVAVPVTSELKLCEPGITLIPGAGPVYRVLEPGSVEHARAVAALSALDEPRDTDRACTMELRLVPTVLASTGGQAVRVHVPIDGCGKPSPDAVAALSQPAPR